MTRSELAERLFEAIGKEDVHKKKKGTIIFYMINFYSKAAELKRQMYQTGYKPNKPYYSSQQVSIIIRFIRSHPGILEDCISTYLLNH